MRKIISFILTCFIFLSATARTRIIEPVFKEGRTILCQNMLKTKGTKYIIKYHFELNEDIVIPARCTLVFEGGCIEGNFSVYGNRSKIIADKSKIFGPEVNIHGSWKVKEVYPQWFGAVGDNKNDDTEAFIGMFNFPCKKKVIPPGDYSVKEIMTDGINNSSVYGYGATLYYSRYNLDDLSGEMYGQVLCNYTINNKPKTISHDLGDISIYGLTINGHRELFSYDSVATKVTSITNHHAIRFICGSKISLYECAFLNTFMTAVICEGCDELIVDRCKISKSGECTKYKPLGYFYTWEGVGLDDRCYLDNKTQYIKCSKCIVKNSFFEDIAGSYASANCAYFECFNNYVVNNIGYLHEISGHINHGSRVVKIHDNIVNGLGSSLCMLNNFNIEDNTDNEISFYNNTVKGIRDVFFSTIPNVSQLWYENFKLDSLSTGRSKTVITNNILVCSSWNPTGNMTINSTEVIIDGNDIQNYGNGAENNQLIYLPKKEVKRVDICNNTITGCNAYLVLLNYCGDYLNISDNKITFTSKPDALSTIVRGNWKDVNSDCLLSIQRNQVKGLQYIYSSGVNYNGCIEMKDNVTDAKIGLYFNNSIGTPINCLYNNNILSQPNHIITNAKFGLKEKPIRKVVTR